MITIDDIQDIVPSLIFSRGVSYERQGRVHELIVSKNGTTVDARVRGTRRQPYVVRIVAPSRGSSTELISSCSCPMGGACKHVVAAAIAMVRAQRCVPSQPRPDSVAASENDISLTAWLRRIEATMAPADGAPSVGDERIAYVFGGTPPFPMQRAFPVTIAVLRLTKSGRWTAIRTMNVDALTSSSARAVRPYDAIIGRFLRLYESTTTERTDIADDLMRRIIATGCAYFESAADAPLKLGPQRAARLTWTLATDGRQLPALVLDNPDARALPVVAWYVDRTCGVAGPIDAGMPRATLRAFLTAPPLEAAHARQVRARFGTTFDLALPPPLEIIDRIERVQPEPCLTLRSLNVAAESMYRWNEVSAPHTIDIAEFTFLYGAARVDPATTTDSVRHAADGVSIVYERDPDAEMRAAQRVKEFGFINDESSRWRSSGSGLFLRFLGEEAGFWPAFSHAGVAELRAEGWQIEFDPTFRHGVTDLASDAAWFPRIEQNEKTGWFDLGIGLDIDGERYELLPLLRDLLQRDRLSKLIEARPDADDNVVYVSLGNIGKTVAFPADRLRAIVQTLVELADPDALRAEGHITLPRTRLAIFHQLEAASGLHWAIPAHLRTLAERLRASNGIARVPVPKLFVGTLRPYQLDGLDWLQFLSAHGLGGILADDMGLGKSVQTLAHLARQKETRRLKQPVLLVVPTSLVHSWCDEAARFTPKLRVLALHGPARAERFSEIADYDLIITTYALLVRDALLHKREWQAVIFDEAQAMKNPQSKAAQVAMMLRAEHRLCLTGTPVENHLGDLWTLFSLVLPGMLGDRKQFGRLFRTPIEKHGDADRRRVLAERVAPFLLRRTKEAVARDLPEKTEILRRIELTGAQSDLYETVRLAMHDRVQREIEEHGFARSHIVILDALLKLRQVCCDPRLLPPQLRRSAASAKLEHLFDMLPLMIAEGRRVLLFSQFTSMLALIEPELLRRSIPYALLTGDTKDRASVVKRFQRGEVPVFLISLKAGGVGLNLTAADTVIHYDPWWNPAVERQATDRAHRIGQTEHVFVYKLIGAGTVEEKIVELQNRKGELAAAIYSENQQISARFEKDDIDRLFAPLGALDTRPRNRSK